MRWPPQIEPTKSPLGIAWDEFTRAIDEAGHLIEGRDEWNAIAERARHARELFDIIEGEIANSRCVTAIGARELLAQLRDRLQSLENRVTPAGRRRPNRPGASRPALGAEANFARARRS